MASFANLSINELLGRLHSAILSFTESVDKVIEGNKRVSASDISMLRKHVKDRLARGESPAENAKILDLLELFTTNKVVLELVREDAEEWLEFLDEIERYIKSKGGTPPEVREEVQKIRKLTSEIRTLVRDTESE
jgi:hypothetical protein